MDNINIELKKSYDELTKDDQKRVSAYIADRLLIEHKKNDKSGIYGITQYTFAYNSNHMEGSTLTENQTRDLFETGTLPVSGNEYKAKHVEEATGHFMMFNEMLHTYDQALNEDIIKKYHYRLKIGVFEDMANGYPCGEYKIRANRVSDIRTALPQEVAGEMQDLLKWYEVQDKSLNTLAKFHAWYENIHPFQDGNGRTGRMILFKECLKNGLIPVLIHEENRPEYIKALNKAQKEKNYDDLIQMFKKEQSFYFDIAKEFLYDFSEDRKRNILKEKFLDFDIER